MFVSHFLIEIYPKETLIRLGKVPKPKNIISNAPSAALPEASDQVRVEYIKPQGNQPHNIPNMTACLLEVTGINLLLKGEI